MRRLKSSAIEHRVIIHCSCSCFDPWLTHNSRHHSKQKQYNIFYISLLKDVLPRVTLCDPWYYLQPIDPTAVSAVMKSKLGAPRGTYFYLFDDLLGWSSNNVRCLSGPRVRSENQLSLKSSHIFWVFTHYKYNKHLYAPATFSLLFWELSYIANNWRWYGAWEMIHCDSYKIHRGKQIQICTQKLNKMHNSQ